MKAFLAIALSIGLIFAGCAPSKEKTDEDKKATVQNKGGKKVMPPNQKLAKQAEQEINKMKEVEKAAAITSDGKLLLAFRVTQFNKFRIKGIEKKVEERLKKRFPDKEVIASSDLKLFIETEELKKNLEKTSRENLTKKIDNLNKLKEEKT